jgi:hypothetical protein
VIIAGRAHLDAAVGGSRISEVLGERIQPSLLVFVAVESTLAGSKKVDVDRHHQRAVRLQSPLRSVVFDFAMRPALLEHALVINLVDLAARSVNEVELA